MRLFHALTRRPLISLIVLYILALLLLDHAGFFAASRNTMSRSITGRYADVEGRVVSLPERKNDKLRFVVKATSIDGRKADGEILVTLVSRDNSLPVKQGDVIAFGARLLAPPPARNPGTFDYAAYLSRKGIHTVAYAGAIVKTGHVPLPFYRAAANAVRADLTAILYRYFPQREAGVLTPMLIGDKSGLSDDEKDAFQISGLTHILVVSGLNVGYVAVVFLGLFRLTGLRRRYAALCTIPFILLFMLAVGDNPPVVRATVMAVFVILALSLAREPLMYQSLALAAAVILIADPQALFTASFQLSFAATIGIVHLYPLLMQPFRNLPRWIRVTAGTTFAVSLAAQLAVLPIIAYDFNRIPVIGVLSNIVVVPWAGIITALGILVYLVHFVSPAITAGIAGVTGFLLHWMLYFVHLFARLPYATVSVATPPAAVIAAYYLLLAGLPHIGAIHNACRRALAAKRWKIPVMIAGATAAPAIICITLLSFAVPSTGKKRPPDGAPLTITSLYAGNGTAVHVSFPNGRHWLIDTGRTRDGERVLQPYLRGKGVRHIDGIIITSGDKHHCGGTNAITGGFTVVRVLYPRNSGKHLARMFGNTGSGKTVFEEVASSGCYHIESSTLTLLSVDTKKGSTLAVVIDYAGKRIDFVDHGDVPGHPLLTQKNADILHLSCHRQQTVVDGCIALLKPDTILLSGTPPERLPATGKIYSLRDHGAVSMTVTSEGIHIKSFQEGDKPAGAEGK